MIWSARSDTARRQPQFRSEIDASQQDIIRKQVNDAVQVIDRHVRGEQWEEAHREAVQLAEMFPGNEQVMRLPQEIEARRSALKKQLVDSLRAAAARHDNDGAIEILKQVDPYLTRDEAAELEDLARGVFKERLANLKNQFSAAALEHRYTEAVRLGDVIISEYPNTRMAQEVLGYDGDAAATRVVRRLRRRKQRFTECSRRPV